MITPRHTRLLRVPDLAAFQTVLVDIIGGLTPFRARDTFVVVPTRAAAEQLRRTVEHRLLTRDRPALVMPIVGTRSDWYDELAARFERRPRLLTPFEREVIVASSARAVAEEGVEPPFDLRAGLIAEMLALYDHVRRLGRSVADFDRNLRNELERDREIDRGAEKLFQQTVFLTAVFERYESRLEALAALDEHGIRGWLTRTERDAAVSDLRPLERIVVTVGDRIGDPDGLWPADLDLLATLPGLAAVDLLCTESALASGLLERLHGILPDLSEERPAAFPSAAPTLVVPPPEGGGGSASITFNYRDREEELAAVVRRVKAERRNGRPVAPLHRTALVVRRPLPYLYVARDVFANARIPFETLDTLPLAAEPYAAALDLLLDAVSSDFARASVIALLRSPHFQLDRDGVLTTKDVAALDTALSESKYLGGLERFAALLEEWASIDVPASRDERRRKVAVAAAAAAIEPLRLLAPLGSERPLSEQIDTIVSWLARFDRPGPADSEVATRRLRVRAAILGALTLLREAYEQHDPHATGDLTAVAAAIRRWLGSQTFAVATGEPGLQIVDAQAARYGEFDDLQLVGLIDGEWPERFRRNVLYPSSLLAQLEPLPVNPDPGRRERDALNAARAAFKDLLHLSRGRVRLSSFVLEHDSVVEPSILIDEVEGQLPARETVPDAAIRVFQSDALALEPRRTDVLDEATRRWADARLAADAEPRRRFQGEAGPWTMPRVSVSRLERYLDCPFRFFASEVLRLEEQPEDEDTRTPLERGRFLHDLFERFFAEWQLRGHKRIDAASLWEARLVFTEICEGVLSELSPAEATLERTRLLGSAVSPGIAHRVFAMEAERQEDVVERLLEFPLQGDFEFAASDGRRQTVTLSAKTDRIDLLADGTMRVIDYKSKKTPELKIALQLPIYSHCARVSLDGHGGRTWRLSEALYLSFEGNKAVVPFKGKGRTVDDLILDAQDRLLTALERIADGSFPPQPSKKSLCGPCPYAAVCRLEYVESEEAEEDA